MPDLTFTFNATAGSADHVKTISTGTEDRFLDWLWYAYPQLDDTDPENPVPKPRNAANEAAAYRDWCAGVISGTWSNVKRWEQNEAAQVARDGVGDLD